MSDKEEALKAITAHMDTLFAEALKRGVSREEAALAGVYVTNAFLRALNGRNQTEAAYRRGYYHGYCAALRDAFARSAQPRSSWFLALDEFCRKRLRAWRVAKPVDRAPPPSPEGGA